MKRQDDNDVNLLRELTALRLRHETLQKQLANATLTRDQQAKAASERQDQLVQLARLRDEQAALAEMRKQEIEALTRVRLKLEKDNTSLSVARAEQAALATRRLQQFDALKKTNAALEKEYASLERQRDKQVQMAEALREERDALKKENKEHKARAKDLKSAESRLKVLTHQNDLLMMQLRQVQDELEHYFHLHQEIRKQLYTAEERWIRVLQHNPAYFDFSTIEFVEQNGQRSTWLMKDFNGAGRRIPQLRFQTFIENNCAALVLTRGDDDKSPLLRWPAPERAEIQVLLSGDAQQLQDCVSILLNLGGRDWTLVQLLVQALGSALDNGSLAGLPVDFNRAELQRGVQLLSGLLQQFPDTLRYETLVLKREQVNADYEHLWFRVGNLSLGKERWPAFEFRLACANVGPQDFGGFPKLEFPQENGQAPFDSWFAETTDDFGPKLELRFGPNAMDMAVWQALSGHDRQFIEALIKLLPIWLNALQQSGCNLQRPWDNWVRLSRNVQQLLLRHAHSGNSPDIEKAAQVV